MRVSYTVMPGETSVLTAGLTPADESTEHFGDSRCLRQHAKARTNLAGIFGSGLVCAPTAFHLHSGGN